jgi:hypothetical protein
MTRFFVLLIISAVLSYASCAFAGDESGSIVRNGGFEIGTETGIDPVVWRATRVPQTSEHVSFDWDHKIFCSGDRSVSISIHETHTDDRIHYNWNQHILGFIPGETYELSAWIKTENLKTTAFIVVQFWNLEMTEVIGSASIENKDKVTGTSDWLQVRATVEVPDETKRMVILAGLEAPANRGGKVWFDDIQIVRKAGNK